MIAMVPLASVWRWLAAKLRWHYRGIDTEAAQTTITGAKAPAVLA